MKAVGVLVLACVAWLRPIQASLWPQVGTSKSICGEISHDVSSQAACQREAIAKGSTAYQYSVTPSKCGVCESSRIVRSNTEWPWRIFAPAPLGSARTSSPATAAPTTPPATSSPPAQNAHTDITTPPATSSPPAQKAHTGMDFRTGGCTGRFTPPAAPPGTATGYNGVIMQDVCMPGEGEHHVFVIGDWGGVLDHGAAVPRPADHRGQLFAAKHRQFVAGVDDIAQQKVAQQMKQRAPISKPEYILNVGDNFYWAGVTTQCGAAPATCNDASGQWAKIFDAIYNGPGLDSKQWLGVLGNHDYGGWLFTGGWDQAIGYTWSKAGSQRWVTPAQYWAQKVKYSDFSVDYFFTDSNVWDAFAPDSMPGHNICSKEHNNAGANCGPTGPHSVDDCVLWFQNLWAAQLPWLESHLHESISLATWQIVVTHHPPEGSWGFTEWSRLTKQYGIDLILSGHRHCQEVHVNKGGLNYLISGGGGGITSEPQPDAGGNDDSYGFFDLTLSAAQIKIEAISHGGQVRSTNLVFPVAGSVPTRPPHWNASSLQHLEKAVEQQGSRVQKSNEFRKVSGVLQQGSVLFAGMLIALGSFIAVRRSRQHTCRLASGEREEVCGEQLEPLATFNEHGDVVNR